VNDLGATQLKNIADPILTYSLEVSRPAQTKPAPTTPSAAVARRSFLRWYV
jgi:hypothetical protein